MSRRCLRKRSPYGITAAVGKSKLALSQLDDINAYIRNGSQIFVDYGSSPGGVVGTSLIQKFSGYIYRADDDHRTTEERCVDNVS